MPRRLQAGIFLLAAVLAGAAGLYLGRASLSTRAVEGAAQRLMLTSLPDPRGKQQRMSQWQGKVLVVNFWATWCAPCREEIPALIKAQHKHAPNGVQFVGISVDDVYKVRDYAEGMRIDYALLIGGMEILSLSKDLGNRAEVLPFTVVLDRNGKVAYMHAGALTEGQLDGVLNPLLKRSQL